MVVGNRNWNRVEAELQARIPGNREHGLRHPDNQRNEQPKVSEIDTESILKHIEEALQADVHRI
jgi:hypothetical protein